MNSHTKKLTLVETVICRPTITSYANPETYIKGFYAQVALIEKHT